MKCPVVTIHATILSNPYLKALGKTHLTEVPNFPRVAFKCCTETFSTNYKTAWGNWALLSSVFTALTFITSLIDTIILAKEWVKWGFLAEEQQAPTGRGEAHSASWKSTDFFFFYSLCEIEESLLGISRQIQLTCLFHI